MTITDIYFDSFTEMMEKHGFIKKNKMFIRKIGDDIIQALSIRGRMVPFYDFVISVFPLWVWKARIRLPGEVCEQYIKKKYWVEDGYINFFGYRDFPFVQKIGHYQRPINYYPSLPVDERRKTLLNFEKAVEQTEAIYIPLLDKIVDYNSYLDFRTADANHTGIRFFGILSNEELIYKAYLDGNFSWGKEFLYREREKRLKIDFNPYVSTMYSKSVSIEEIDPVILKRLLQEKISEGSQTELPKILFSWLSKIKQTERRNYERFYNCLEQNDFLWIVDVKNRMHEDSEALFRRFYNPVFRE